MRRFAARPDRELFREKRLRVLGSKARKRTTFSNPPSGLARNASLDRDLQEARSTVARAVFNKVIAMQESGTYQLILEEGAVKHTRELIVRLGSERLGAPEDKQKNKLNAIEDLDRLDRIALKVLTANSWDALLRVR